MRTDGRTSGELRPLQFRLTEVGAAAGACLVRAGRTTVLCTATLETGVPPWMAGRGQGWITAEYGMLPASTGSRKARDGRRGAAVDGRSVEIQRLIGRTLRPALDRRALGERTITIDCDVLVADGGTRVAAINGAWLALAQALRQSGNTASTPLIEVVAVSVAVVAGQVVLDPDYREDSAAEADMNLVLTAEGRWLEVQASAEGRPFSRAELIQALDLAEAAVPQILAAREIARREGISPLFAS